MPFAPLINFYVCTSSSMTVAQAATILLQVYHWSTVYNIFYVSPIKELTPVVPWLSYSPLDLRFVGSNPAGVNGFFQSVKILSVTSFGREVKPWVLCHRFMARKRTSSEIRAFEQNLSDFSFSMYKAMLMT